MGLVRFSTAFTIFTLLTVPNADAAVTCSFTQDQATANSVRVKIAFSEQVRDLTEREIQLENGILNEFSPLSETEGGAKLFVFKLEAKVSGTSVSVKIPAAAARGSVSGSPNIECGPWAPQFGSVSVQPSATATRAPTAGQSTPSPVPTTVATSTPARQATVTPSATPTRASNTPAPATPTPQPPTGSACTDLRPGTPTRLRVFPKAEGFGAFTTAGSGRHLLNPCSTVYRVTNLKDSGIGSLRACMEASGPRTCVFETSGMIWATKDIRITQPFLTVAGQTAPSPGIAIRGSGINIEASNVLLQHLRLRVGDDPRDPCCQANSCSAGAARFCTADPGSRDGVRIISSGGPIQDIVVDHVSVSWALDEGMSVVPDRANVSNLTISNSIIGHGLDMSIHPEASNPADPGHSKGLLVNGAFALKNFSFVKNLMAHNAERNIRIATPVTMEYVNNVIYNWGRGRGSGRTIELYNKLSAVHAIDIIGNNYLPGPETFCPETNYRSELCFENGDGIDTVAERRKMHFVFKVGSGLTSSSRYFLADNIGPTRNSGEDEWAAADRGLYSGASLIYPENKAAVRQSSSGSVEALSSGVAYQYVLGHAGSRPKERDVVDSGLIRDVSTGTGRIINCVAGDGSQRCSKNAGGWPNYGTNIRPLNLPPNGDDDGDGYTNLEEFLFGFSGAVE